MSLLFELIYAELMLIFWDDYFIMIVKFDEFWFGFVVRFIFQSWKKRFHLLIISIIHKLFLLCICIDLMGLMEIVLG